LTTDECRREFFVEPFNEGRLVKAAILLNTIREENK
jgi:hypothetical protein